MTPESDSWPPAAAPAADDAEAEPPSWLSLDVQIEDDGWIACGDLEAAIAAAIAALARTLGPSPPAAASIALAADADVCALNREFRGEDKPTNVLSFPAAPGNRSGVPAGRRYLGDIILARETVLAEAAGAGIPVRHHVQHLAVHGLLHLIGHDHAADADAARMEGIEIAVLADLGVANPYADTDPAGLPAIKADAS